MAQWIFLSELDKARHLYLDAYEQLHGEVSPIIEGKYWDDINWLENETDVLVLKWVMGDSLETTKWINKAK